MARFYGSVRRYQPPMFKKLYEPQKPKGQILASDDRYILTTLEGEMAYCNKHLGIKFNVYKFRQCWHCLQEEKGEE